MNKKDFAYLGCTAIVVASGLSCIPTANAATSHVVHPGESIQKAVDAAQSGDTIFIAPGTYYQSVLVTKSGLTLRGAGERTVLMPAATRAANKCAAAGNGICVEGTSAHPVTRTSVRSLTLTGYKKNGLWASNTDKLTVRDVAADKNKNWGIALERSVRSVLEENVARGNTESGIFLSNTVDTEAGATDTRGTVVRHNRLEGNRIGLTVRRLRNVTVEENELSANCSGLFAVGDEGKPHAGALAIRGNGVHENNKYCAKTARLPYIQGSGIVLTGTEDTVVEYNDIRDNVGKSVFSGGVVLYKSFVGTPNKRNVIRDNVLSGNSTADLANRDTGTGNKFEHNSCQLSEPAGMC
ncbi:nitrous oxide reductase family maturation protein NosD [Streptomyces avermitilis]|uniref:right-handed parallel beta-helix repeat-containing protein n=1 Tax=Streptomyces avermitilis TaxID=33903 RepID=UPI00381EE55B